MGWLDLSFKVKREYRKEIRQLAANLDVAQVDAIKEAVGMFVIANAPPEMYPNLTREARESAEKRRNADGRGAGGSALLNVDEPDPLDPKPGKPGKKKSKRKKKG